MRRQALGEGIPGTAVALSRLLPAGYYRQGVFVKDFGFMKT
jgi:hypothetical protein